MARDKDDRVWLYKDIFNEFKGHENMPEDYLGVFKDNDYFLFASKEAVWSIPIDKIKNRSNLGLDDLGTWPDKRKNHDFFNDEMFSSLGEFGTKEISKLLLRESIEGKVSSSYRKPANVYECSVPASLCSKAQGMALGRDYNHCFHCHHSSERNFYEAVIDSNFSFINVSELKEKAAEDLKNEGTSLSIIKYSTFSNKENLGWMERVFGKLKTRVDMFDYNNFSFRKKGGKGMVNEVLKEEMLERKDKFSSPLIRFVYTFKDESRASIVSLIKKEKEIFKNL